VFDRLIESLGRDTLVDDATQMRVPENQLSVAILLFAVLPADNVIRPEESLELRVTLQHLLELDDVKSRYLIDRAMASHARDQSLLACATLLKHRLSFNFRRQLLGAARRIAMSDGRMHDNEADVLARISSLLGLNATERRLSA
jgi:uncharacterized tellurite resistance protein B-like protein